MDDKGLLRTGAHAQRAARSEAERASAGAGIAAHAAEVLALAPPRAEVTVAAYAGVGAEPPTRPLLDALLAAGARVLLPAVAGGTALHWAPYAGWQHLRPGPWGLLEPGGDRLPAAVLAAAAVVLVPALAVDRAGHRLGRGGGFYDRALAAVPVPRRVAVVYADEVRAEVPVEAHDEPVGWVLTPAGLARLSPER